MESPRVEWNRLFECECQAIPFFLALAAFLHAGRPYHGWLTGTRGWRGPEGGAPGRSGGSRGHRRDHGGRRTCVCVTTDLTYGFTRASHGVWRAGGAVAAALGEVAAAREFRCAPVALPTGSATFVAEAAPGGGPVVLRIPVVGAADMRGGAEAWCRHGGAGTVFQITKIQPLGCGPSSSFCPYPAPRSAAGSPSRSAPCARCVHCTYLADFAGRGAGTKSRTEQ